MLIFLLGFCPLNVIGLGLDQYSNPRTVFVVFWDSLRAHLVM